MEKPEVIINVSYTCPICKKNNFDSPEKAMQCRDSHVAPVEIVKAFHSTTRILPQRIEVRFPNGFTIFYCMERGIDYESKYKEFNPKEKAAQ
ncbi:MAG: hypothetical protein A4E55_00349 [Pelotomaculum sp. PtaU1.Bin035]|nr:MAG: hypothetical protein A4E55_00349 [Pelotomaculum sp. PtaU1.Bin035]